MVQVRRWEGPLPAQKQKMWMALAFVYVQVCGRAVVVPSPVVPAQRSSTLKPFLLQHRVKPVMKESSQSVERRHLFGSALVGCLALGMASGGMKDASVARKDQVQRSLVQQMKGMGDYEDLIAGRKQLLFQEALSGAPAQVVEVGIGTGVNLKYLKEAGVKSVVAVEPNEHFTALAAEAAQKAGLQLQVQAGNMEELPFKTASVDVLVATLVLCSVEDMEASIKEVHRVLKPGGCYIFTEHVEAESYPLKALQNLFSPAQELLAANCHLNREPQAMIRAVFGPSNVKADIWNVLGDEHEFAPHFLLSPTYSGFAVKR